VPAKGRADDWNKLANVLVQETLKVAESGEAVKRIAVMVNRVATARLVWRLLTDNASPRIWLSDACGRSTADDLNKHLEPLKSGKPREDTLRFVVSTQCLEVGADLDFDALITECASMDALLQRFGRLDRLGDFQHAIGRVVSLTGQVDGKRPDPVYGDALKQTWDWLSELGPELNFGIEAEAGEAATVAQLFKALEPSNGNPLTIVLPAAPVLLPAHLDCLVQTSPRRRPSLPSIYSSRPANVAIRMCKSCGVPI